MPNSSAITRAPGCCERASSVWVNPVPIRSHNHDRFCAGTGMPALHVNGAENGPADEIKRFPVISAKADVVGRRVSVNDAAKLFALRIENPDPAGSDATARIMNVKLKQCQNRTTSSPLLDSQMHQCCISVIHHHAFASKITQANVARQKNQRMRGHEEGLTRPFGACLERPRSRTTKRSMRVSTRSRRMPRKQRAAPKPSPRPGLGDGPGS
jgi:hypothetical protein